MHSIDAATGLKYLMATLYSDTEAKLLKCDISGSTEDSHVVRPPLAGYKIKPSEFRPHTSFRGEPSTLNEAGRPMLLRRTLLLLAAAVALPVPSLARTMEMTGWQKAAGGRMAFDVASIRLTAPNTHPRSNISLDVFDHYVPTRGLFSVDATLEAFTEFAYKLYLAPEQREALLTKMPKSLTSQRFTINARAGGDPTKDQYRLMMQSLLADRFNLAVHFEQRNVPVLALVLVKPGKLGPYLRAHADAPLCNNVGSVMDAIPSPASGIPGGWNAGWPYACDWPLFMTRSNHLVLWGLRNSTITYLGAGLADMPPRDLGRPVVDGTGLTGTFDFVLEWEWIPASNGAAPAAADAKPDLHGPTLEDAVEKQLGLRLKPTEAPVDFLVIDHVEMPSEN